MWPCELHREPLLLRSKSRWQSQTAEVNLYFNFIPIISFLHEILLRMGVFLFQFICIFFSPLTLSFINSDGTFYHFWCHQTPQRFQHTRWIQRSSLNLQRRSKEEKSEINPCLFMNLQQHQWKLKIAKWETDRKYLLPLRYWKGLVMISCFNRLKIISPIRELHLI